MTTTLTPLLHVTPEPCDVCRQTPKVSWMRVEYEQGRRETDLRPIRTYGHENCLREKVTK